MFLRASKLKRNNIIRLNLCVALNALIIDKDKQYGFNPDYISERSYRSFEDIKVVKYIYK